MVPVGIFLTKKCDKVKWGMKLWEKVIDNVKLFLIFRLLYFSLYELK